MAKKKMNGVSAPKQTRRPRSILEGKQGQDGGLLVPDCGIHKPEDLPKRTRDRHMALLRFVADARCISAAALRVRVEASVDPRFGTPAATPYGDMRNLLRLLVRNGLLEHPEEIGDGQYRITARGLALLPRCPRCGCLLEFRALSRSDNKTYVCGPCGLDEAAVWYGGEPARTVLPGWSDAKHK